MSAPDQALGSTVWLTGLPAPVLVLLAPVVVPDVHEESLTGQRQWRQPQRPCSDRAGRRNSAGLCARSYPGALRAWPPASGVNRQRAATTEEKTYGSLLTRTENDYDPSFTATHCRRPGKEQSRAADPASPKSSGPGFAQIARAFRALRAPDQSFRWLLIANATQARRSCVRRGMLAGDADRVPQSLSPSTARSAGLLSGVGSSSSADSASLSNRASASSHEATAAAAS